MPAERMSLNAGYAQNRINFDISQSAEPLDPGLRVVRDHHRALGWVKRIHVRAAGDVNESFSLSFRDQDVGDLLQAACAV